MFIDFTYKMLVVDVGELTEILLFFFRSGLTPGKTGHP